MAIVIKFSSVKLYSAELLNFHILLKWKIASTIRWQAKDETVAQTLDY